MVTAGVYQLIRCSPQLEYSSIGLVIVTQVGGFSALLGAAGGLQENDQKRIIAFSTTSQLGYMIVACGLSQYSVAIFHQVNHAMFKALQFLSAGAVIHAVADIQDIRKLGGLIQLQPRTYAVVQQGSQSLMAFPFLTGFYSKDFLLELAQIPRNITRSIAYIQAQTAAILSATYSARLIIMTFLAKPHFPRVISPLIMEPPILSSMGFPLFILGLGSAYFGYFSHDLFLGIGSTFYQQILFTHPDNVAQQDGPLSLSSGIGLEYLPTITLMILFAMIPIIHKFTAYNVEGPDFRSGGHLLRPQSALSTSNLSGFKIAQYFNLLNHFNTFYHWIAFYAFKLSVIISRAVDSGFLELIGPLGQQRQYFYLSFRVESQMTGFLLHYAFIMCSAVGTGFQMGAILFVVPPLGRPAGAIAYSIYQRILLKRRGYLASDTSGQP